MFRDGKPFAMPAAESASLSPRLIRVYRWLRGEIAYGVSRQVYRMPAAEALARARRHVEIMSPGGAR